MSENKNEGTKPGNSSPGSGDGGGDRGPPSVEGEKTVFEVRTYKIKHDYNVSEFLTGYRSLLQRAIDIIWENIQWQRRTVERRPAYLKGVEETLERLYNGEELGRFKQIIRGLQKRERFIPIIPNSGEFKRNLRNILLRDWDYCTNYINTAIMTAYQIIKTWKRRYVKGKAGRYKPIIKKKFARIPMNLYYIRKDGKLTISIKPKERYLLFDLSKAWFKDRVEGWKMGEPILKEDELLLIYKKPKTAEMPKKQIAWDMNLMSIDGFSGDQGWLKIDLKPLYTLHITYENIRRNIQKLTKKKPKTARRLRRKYSERHRNRTKDFLHQLTTMISREFKDYQHGFEDLEKQEIVKKRKGKKRGKRRNREVLVTNWGQIISLMSYKAAEVRLIDPRNSSKICPRCGGGMRQRQKGRVLSCGGCGLLIDRQLDAAINLYLRMRGFPPSQGVWEEYIIPALRRSGVALIGAKADGALPMNPEGDEADEAQGVQLSPEPRKIVLLS